MSDQTWLDEFYPVNAKDTEIEDATAHSLRKWIGLRQSNLDKHNVQAHRLTININSGSCALCHHHLKDPAKDLCGTCPLALHLGRPCDDDQDDDEDATPAVSPWYAWSGNAQRRDPEPMITALQETLDGTKE